MSPEARKLFPGGGGDISALGIPVLDSGTANGVGNLGLDEVPFETRRG